MDHPTLLKEALSAASYFMKTSNPRASYVNISGYTVEDLAMDTIERILKADIHMDDLCKTYVRKAVYHTGISTKRRIQLELSPGDLSENKEPTGPLETVDSREEQLISIFTDDQRDLYFLSAVCGLDDSSVSKALGVSSRTVGRRLALLRPIIREHLS